MRSEWILLTGKPGIGPQPTAIKKLVAHLQAHNLNLRGFFTKEVRDEEHGPRVGFDIVTIPKQRVYPLARLATSLNTRSPRTGQYAVNVKAVKEIAVPLLQVDSPMDNTIMVVDEIGRMELHSNLFRRTVERLLEQPSVRLIGTVPLAGTAMFCDSTLRRHPNVTVHELTMENRNDLVKDIIQKLDDTWIAGGASNKNEVEFLRRALHDRPH